MENYIKVSGARENNLKNIDVSIPHGKHTVITGVSGSGKTSLAYNVIYAVGKKRLMDCIDSKGMRVSSQLKQPDVDFIEGLTPIISIRQHKPNRNPRATVGTTTEISSYIRNIYSLLSTAICPLCGKEYPLHTSTQIMNNIKRLPEKTIIEVLFPIYKQRNEKYDDFFADLQNKGYRKVYIDGEEKNLRDWINIETEPQMILVYEGYISSELSKSDIKLLQKACIQGEGFIQLNIRGEENRKANQWFYDGYSCTSHFLFSLDITPSFFNINDLRSSCKECLGTGIGKELNHLALFRDTHKSLQKNPFHSMIYNHTQPFMYMRMYSLSKHFGFSFAKPFDELSEYAQNLVLYGTNGEKFPLIRPASYDKQMPGYVPHEGEMIEFEGYVTRFERYYQNWQKNEFTKSEEDMFNKLMSDVVCQTCHGTGLKQQRSYFKLNGLSYFEFENLEIKKLNATEIIAPNEKKNALMPIMNELLRKTSNLIDIGLSYLSLNRRIDTLSGGEYQRVRIAGQLGSGLTGLTYIFDEPTAGLHGVDTERINSIIRKFISNGSTAITVEHDLDIIKNADYILELGAGSGKDGGNIIAKGNIQDIIQNKNSSLAYYLKNNQLLTPSKIAETTGNMLKIYGARVNNLKNIDVNIPLNQFVCITGVSGSGKSSLAIETLYKALWHRLFDMSIIFGEHDRIVGIEAIKNVYCVDQKPINKAKTSIPASYIKIMDKIREVFADCDEASEYGFTETAYFSYNTKGKCSACNGLGYTETHIHYLGDMQIICPQCNGKRYMDEVLDVKYNGKNISQVLEISFYEALQFFENIPYIRNKIQYVCDLGLGYMLLGQPVNTLSGGEGQRLRLAKELSKNCGKKDILYILDEPTTGLHAKDIENIVSCIRNIVKKGNTVLVIEHNPFIIQSADYIIDMGPGAGNEGGKVVVQGALEDILLCKDSVTGKYLQR